MAGGWARVKKKRINIPGLHTRPKLIFVAGNVTYKPLCRLVGRSACLSHFASSERMSITAPAHPPKTGQTCNCTYTALFTFRSVLALSVGRSVGLKWFRKSSAWTHLTQKCAYQCKGFSRLYKEQCLIHDWPITSSSAGAVIAFRTHKANWDQPPNQPTNQMTNKHSDI